MAVGNNEKIFSLTFEKLDKILKIINFYLNFTYLILIYIFFKRNNLYVYKGIYLLNLFLKVLFVKLRNEYSF